MVSSYRHYGVEKWNMDMLRWNPRIWQVSLRTSNGGSWNEKISQKHWNYNLKKQHIMNKIQCIFWHWQTMSICKNIVALIKCMWYRELAIYMKNKSKKQQWRESQSMADAELIAQNGNTLVRLTSLRTWVWKLCEKSQFML